MASFLTIFAVYQALFGLHCAVRFPTVLSAVFFCCFRCFGLRAKQGRRAKIDTPSTRKRDFSRCAPAPAQAQGRQQKAKKDTQHKATKLQKISKKTCNSSLPGQTSTNRSQKVVREPPPEPPGSAPGGPRRPQEAPRAPQDGPKSRQERPKSRPEPVSERPGWPPGPHLAPKKPPEASRKPFWLPRGSISAPPGFHF